MFMAAPPRSPVRSGRLPWRRRALQSGEMPKSSVSSRAVMRALSKITGRPLPGWVAAADQVDAVQVLEPVGAGGNAASAAGCAPG